MQAYSREFARVYNLKWADFAKQVAPFILNFFASTPTGQTNKTVLDLCCGTGHFSMPFLENGYKVTGIDLSEHMLQYARENARSFVESGQGKFIKADASDFTLNERFGLVIATYDSLNHLADEKALVSCFRCAHAVCDGYIIFDLNTRSGLKNWNSIYIDEDNEDILIITRGIYDEESNRALAKITGFAGVPNGLYQRFEETVYNTVFKMDAVKKALFEVGWKNVHFARIQDLSTPLAEPENEPRVFIVASK